MIRNCEDSFPRLLRGPKVYGEGPRCTVATGAPPTLYAKIAKGLFVPPIPLSERAVAWPESEVSAPLAARIAGHNEDQSRRSSRISWRSAHGFPRHYTPRNPFPHTSRRQDHGRKVHMSIHQKLRPFPSHCPRSSKRSTTQCALTKADERRPRKHPSPRATLARMFHTFLIARLHFTPRDPAEFLTPAVAMARSARLA